jgi:ceramide synthetase
VFRHIANAILPHKAKWTPEERAGRVERCGTVMFKLLYFIALSAAGWHLLHDQPYLPAELGGSGHADHAFTGYPMHPLSPWIKYYYMFQLGYHTQSLLFQVGMTHRNDLLEMVLHHFCAIFLLVLSYLSNFYRVGVLVLFVHDLADITGYAIKTSVDTSYTKVTISVYLSLLTVWGYTRLYVYPFTIIASVNKFYESLLANGEAGTSKAQIVRLQQIMLSVLYLLHIYWYIMFLIMGASFLKTGKTRDIQQKIEVDSPKTPNSPGPFSNASSASASSPKHTNGRSKPKLA